MSAQRRTVLVVDDEPDILLTTKGFLQAAFPGLQVETAATAEEGIARLDAGGVDLVLSDYRMPGATGVDLLLHAWQVAPTVPRILMTAYPDMRVAVDALERAHIRAFLIKPVDPEQLAALVGEVLGALGADKPGA